MSVFKSAEAVTKEGSRRIIVMGAPGTGKTTFSLSASRHAGDVIGGKSAVCSDVAVLQGDSNGIAGAIDAGLTPGLVVDMTVCQTWPEYSKLLTAALVELKPLVDAGTVQYLVVDLSLPAKLLIDHIKPGDQQGWGKVAVESMTFYKAFGFLRGATIIANAQIKSAVAAVENSVAQAAAEAKAVGGERATFTADLVKSFYALWSENSSLTVSRELKKKRNPMKPNEPATAEFFSHCYGSSRFECKSRHQTKLLPTEPGARTLHSLLKDCYGENL